MGYREEGRGARGEVQHCLLVDLGCPLQTAQSGIPHTHKGMIQLVAGYFQELVE